MKIHILGSGSAGNSILVNAGSTSVLIDAGLSCREITQRAASVGHDVSKISGILISHEHSDHTRGAPLVSGKNGLPVFINKSTHDEIIRRRRDFDVAMVEHFETGDTVSFNGLQVRTFRVDHDTVDPVGFVVTWKNFKVGIVTDVGQSTRLLEERLKDCDAVVIESNHDINLLNAGPYPIDLKQRIKSKNGHLSNRQCSNLLKKIYHPGMSHIVLAHLSETNNSPFLAYTSACRSLTPANIPPKIIVASQSKPASMNLSKRLREVMG